MTMGNCVLHIRKSAHIRHFLQHYVEPFSVNCLQKSRYHYRGLLRGRVSGTFLFYQRNSAYWTEDPEMDPGTVWNLSH